MAKILIVDDYIDLVELLTDFLESKGHEVETPPTVDSLYESLSHFHPDLIILDVRFRDLDGRKICKEIKLQWSSVPIILISASPELLKNYKECYADAIIEKPFDLSTIIEKVESVLGKFQRANLN